MVILPTQISVTRTVLLLWIYLFLLTWLFLNLEILIILSQFPLCQSVSIVSVSKEVASFRLTVQHYSHADWDSLCDHLKDVSCEDMFKLCTSTMATVFCEWDQVGIDVRTPYRIYQVKPHSSLWSSAACAAAIAHKNHFFRLYQKSI